MAPGRSKKTGYLYKGGYVCTICYYQLTIMDLNIYGTYAELKMQNKSNRNI